MQIQFIHRALTLLEKAGNRFPHPTLLFVWIIAFILLLSMLASLMGWSATHPVTNAPVGAVNLMSGEGLRMMISQLIPNFMGFAPVGPVLIAMLGLGIAERSGLLDLLLKMLVNITRGKGLSGVVVLLGVLSSIAADSGYVVLIPLAAVLFKSAGKPPLAGIAAAFMGVSGGYSANLLIGPVDVVLAGMSTEAATIFQPGYQVAVTANYYFMAASTVLIAVVGGWITESITIPFLNKSQSKDQVVQKAAVQERTAKAGRQGSEESLGPDLSISKEQRQAVKQTAILFSLYLLLVLLVTLPEGAPLRNQETGALLPSPFITNIVVIIALGFAVAGITYGKKAGTLPDQTAVILSMEETLKTLAGYLVLMFFAAQMVALFSWSQLGLIFAIKGAEGLASLELSKPVLLVMLLMLVATINLLMGSASAKWALLAPIFVPMLMILGVPPEWTQLTYRIGDSATNIITPLMPYFALVVAYMQKYQPESGLGTLMAVMLPYSAIVLVVWALLLVGWSLLGLPIGPNG